MQVASRRTWPIWSLGLVSAALFPRDLWGWVYGYVVLMFQGQVLDWVDYFHYHKALGRFFANPHSLYLASSKITQIGFLYPPLSVLFFMPFYRLPMRYAYILCGAIIYATTAAAGYLVAKLYERTSGETLSADWKAAIIFISIGFTPTMHNAIFGQVNSIVLLLCLGYIWMVLERMEFVAGLVLAAAIWLKLYPVLMLLLVLHDRRYWRSVPGLVCGLALPPLFFSRYIPLFLYKQYFLEFLPEMSSRTILHAMNQSLPATLSRMHLGIAAYESWKAVKITFFDRQINNVFFAMLLLLLFKIRGTRGLVFEAAVCGVIPWVIGLGWGYTYLMVLPLAVVTLLQALREERVWPSFAVMLAFSAFIWPSYRPMPFQTRVPELLRVVFYSRYLLAGLVLFFTSLLLLPTGRRESVIS
jgi:alpha-1,2-mannosyltransferase